MTNYTMPDFRVELALGDGYSTPAASRNWTDITSKVRLENNVLITRGRADEGTVPDPSKLNLTLDNRDGRFTAGLATGAYYPNIKIGRPIRVRCRWPLNQPGNMHPNPSAETNAAFWTTTTEFGADDLAQSIAQSAVRGFDGTKSILATWPTTAIGSNAGVFVGGHVAGRTYIASMYVWVPTGSPNVRLDCLFLGSSSFTALKDQWVRLSCTYTATQDSVYVSVQCASATSGNSCFVDAVMVDEGTTLNAYTAAPVPILERYTGYVDQWPNEWSEGSDAYAEAQITGFTRTARLGFGAQLRDVIGEEYLLDWSEQFGLAGSYFPLGEPDGSTVASDVCKNSTSTLTATQLGAGGTLTFGANTGPGTDGMSAPDFLPSTLTNGLYLAGAVRGCGFFGITLEAFMLTTTAAKQTVIRCLDGGGTWIEIRTTAAGKIEASDFNRYNGTADFTITSAASFNDGLTHHVALTMTGTGTINCTLYVDGVNVGTAAFSAVATMVANVLNVGGNITGQLFTGTISHATINTLGLSSTRIGQHSLAGSTGFAGELAADRIKRYAGYAGIPAAEIDADGSTNPVEAFDITGKTAIDAMRVIEATETGVLFDGKDNVLEFRGRAARYNVASAFTLTTSTQQIEPDVSPVLDRSSLVNDVTATASDGTTVRAANQSSIDMYGFARASIDIAGSTETAFQAAGWKVNTYGEPQPRVPSLSVDWMPLPAGVQNSILAADVGTRLTAAALPAQAPATSIAFFVEGYVETIGVETYDFTFNLSPTTGYDVWILDDATYGAYDTYPLSF